MRKLQELLTYSLYFLIKRNRFRDERYVKREHLHSHPPIVVDTSIMYI